MGILINNAGLRDIARNENYQALSRATYAVEAEFASIRQDLVSEFAELACLSSKSANRLLGEYPDYRFAKDDLCHRFWPDQATAMLSKVKSTATSLFSVTETDFAIVDVIRH